MNGAGSNVKRSTSSNGFYQVSFRGVRRQMRVQRGEFAFVLPRSLDEPGIIDLLMPQRSQINRGRIGGGRIPKLMRLVVRPLLEQRGGVLRGNRVACIGRVGRKPDESQLSESAGCPAVFGVRGKPGVRLGVMLVIRPRQRQQHIGVKQRNFHVASSSSNAFARLLGITGALP